MEESVTGWRSRGERNVLGVAELCTALQSLVAAENISWLRTVAQRQQKKAAGRK
jgi:hypothetical protein